MAFSFQRNLISLIFIKIAKWMNLVMPIIVLFYKSNGLSMQDIFILQSVYSFSLMLLEIPSGYFADKVGRRHSILIGTVFGFIGFLMYSISYGFWQFAVAETVLGLGMSLVSGADSAILYDSLSAAGHENRYTRFDGRITMAGNFAEAFAGIIGGLIAVSSLRTPYYIQTIVAFSGIAAALFLREPPIKETIIKPILRDIPKIVRNVLQTNKKLKWNTLFSALTGASTLSMAWLVQPYFIKLQMPTEFFGISWAILNLCVGLAALYAWKIEKRFGPARTVLLFTVSLCVSYFILAFSTNYSGILILLVFYMARGVATPTLRSYINNISTSDVRATVLSVRNFIIRMIFAILGPFFGWINDKFSLGMAMLIAGTIYSILSSVTLYKFLKHKTYSS